jgi:hypothetical protein
VNNLSVVDNFIEVELPGRESFSIIKESLTRIGIPSRKELKLFQTCHILHKQGKYYIVHFLEMFMLDGKESHFSEDDRLRRNRIASLLEEWGLLTIVNKELVNDKIDMNKVKIIPHGEKDKWSLVQKYTIGKRTPY